MSYPACLALLICSLVIVCCAGFLAFLNSALRKEQRPKFPTWTVALASVALITATVVLLEFRASQPQIVNSLALSAALLAGLSLKWLMETAARKKPTIHEGVLFRALLAAPIAVALFPTVFGSRPTPPGLLLWFLNGFFWLTLFGDLERLTTHEPVIIRRREPPTLPHDFRRPEVE
jgi:hypothetical protein